MNAKLVKLELNSTAPIKDPKHMIMLTGDTNHLYEGSIACVAVFETSLEISQLRYVMKSCP